MQTQLGQKPVGSIVKLQLDGTPTNFIVVNQGIPQSSPLYDSSCDGTWLLLEKIQDSKPYYESSVANNTSYSDSSINSWLNSTFFARLNSDVQKVVSQVKIPYRVGSTGSTVNSGESGLLVKVFLLSGLEVGYTKQDDQGFPTDGALLSYFLSGSGYSANEKRIANHKTDGKARDWRLRSPDVNDDKRTFIVQTDGTCETLTTTNNLGVRAAMILPKTVYVDDDGTIIANNPPEAPESITVPSDVKGGSSISVSWTASSDPDGNLTGYELERKTNVAEWDQVYKGDQLNYTDQITKGWQTVQYRVRAVDSYNAASSYAESETRTVDNNSAPVITCEHPSGSDLGEKAEPFTVSYTVTDPDGDRLTVTETLDSETTRSDEEVESGTTLEAASLNTPDGFQKILNGSHTLKISASDSKASATYTLTFAKKITSASVTLNEPLSVEGDITKAVLRIIGNIPSDAVIKAEVTNNALDDSPAWQDVTENIKSGNSILFANHTAERGAAFNFRISVRRGPSDTGGYIRSITGGFQ